jgi:ABC-2 type transport system permease protein
VSAPPRAAVEQKLFWRSRELAFFTFLLPIVFFVLLGSVYGDKSRRSTGVTGADYLLAGMLGYGVDRHAFAGLAISLTIRRESGILKRLRATPLPPVQYFGGVLARRCSSTRSRQSCSSRSRASGSTPTSRPAWLAVLALLLGALASRRWASR